MQKKVGRPTIKTQELLDRICFLTATNALSLKKLCEKYDDLPAFITVWEWRLKDMKFASQYAEAKRIQQDLVVEELEEPLDNVLKYEDENGNVKIDSGSVMLERARIDTRKWQAAKLAPKAYADRTQFEEKVQENLQLKQEIAELRAKLDAQNKKEY